MNKENKSKNISPFCGEKYSVWKFRVKALLAENDVLFVIEKEKPQEIDEIWKKAERSAKGVIIEFLSDSFLSFADNNSTAKEIFEKLDSIYERKSLATQLSVRKQLLTFKLNSDTPLIIHFNKFDELICELMSSGAKIEEVDKVAHLLLTLPSIYDGVVTAIETLSAEHVTLSFVKNRLLDHETKIKNISRDTSNKVLQAISPNDNKQKALHLKSNFKAKSSKNFKFNLKCHHCGRKGHLKKDCFFFKKVLENKDEEKQAQVANVVDQVETGRSFAFMLRQGRNNTGDADISFILDSGASDHMINNINLFSTYSTLDTPIEIAIAKQGAYIYASAKGTVQLCSDRNTNITLENVLFCKEVPQNLLSVRKMQAAGLTVEFNSKGIRISKNGQEILEEHQVADVLTKPLPAARFLTLRHEMGLKN